MSCNVISNSNYEREYINLAGEWKFTLVKDNFTDKVQLPGSLDENSKGNVYDFNGETRFLSRKYIYEGKAWFQKEIQIPTNWDGSHIELYLERTRPTSLWVDSLKVGDNNIVSAPQIYDISSYVQPGKTHVLTILVENSEDRLSSRISYSHVCSAHTQTNWNGILGKILLRKSSKNHINKVKLTPNINDKNVAVVVDLSLVKDEKESYKIKVECSNELGIIESKTVEVAGEQNSIIYPMGQNIKLWDEFNPNLYTCTISLLNSKDQLIDKVEERFGMREFTAEGINLYNNGKRVFLRGKHDGAVFPLTAYAPMEKAGWLKYMQVCKDYGINHVRFHSWCPPKAAMEVADELGIYLEIELPFWGTISKTDSELLEMLKVEAKYILDAYANHPSVVLMALGNELRGDNSKLVNIVKFIKNERPELLTATGANNFLGTLGPDENDEFSVVCRIGGNKKDPTFERHVRASFSYIDAKHGGYINNEYPNSKMNFSPAFKYAKVPVIGHETGQYQCFPNFNEIEKYTGVLRARNMEIFKERLEKKGMLHQAEDFRKASGAWQTLLYRADIEMNLRTKEISGFQLLDLQDYSGQGTALVGILDAFMDSKGFIEPQDWRRFCSPLVPLAILDKFVYQGGEKLSGEIKISNYSASDIKQGDLKISLKDASGEIIYSKEEKINAPIGALSSVANLNIDLPKVEVAQKMTLEIDCGAADGANIYSLWIYKNNENLEEEEDFKLVTEIDNRLYRLLRRGQKVLLIPNKDQLKEQSLKGLFMTDYWNYRMFRQICVSQNVEVSPGTLGLLIKPEHAALKGFPTSFHTDMQWYSIIKESRPLILDNLKNLKEPVVQVIDNFERNHKLGLILECKVGKGSLLICMSDLLALTKYPEAKALYNSLVNYIKSNKFNPEYSCSEEELEKLFTTAVPEVELEDLKNTSYDYKKKHS